ncbi:hypothetical protein [Streptomyces sparsogenes]|uniref:hypothetical protein n=1 Tax=Streptomyces sparsogenes TaxID=67365 RepID=UPI0033D063B6
MTRALPWTPPSGPDVKVLPTGTWWDAVRASGLVGEYALKLLGDASGAVIQDRHGPLYWLVEPGSADGWDVRQVRVLGGAAARASYVGVPPAHWTGPPGIHWRIPVGPGRYLTDPALLHQALALAARAELGPVGEAGPVSSRICARCDRPTSTPLVVGQAHSSSVGGRDIYSCPTCVRTFPQPVDPITQIDALRRTRQEGA